MITRTEKFTSHGIGSKIVIKSMRNKAVLSLFVRKNMTLGQLNNAKTNRTTFQVQEILTS